MNNIRKKKSFDIYSLLENKVLEKSLSVTINNPVYTSRDNKHDIPKNAKNTHKTIPYEYYYLAYRI